jgi:hypothetical protein
MASVGGNTGDMHEAIQLISEGMNPADMISHTGGINVVI